MDLLRKGRRLEYLTLSWNVVGVAILAVSAFEAKSVGLAGFGLDSLVEIGASTVVLWELSERHESRQRAAIRLIGVAFIFLALYLLVQSTLVLALGFHPHHSGLGIAWTALTALSMFSLSYGKSKVGAALSNPVLIAEGRVTFVDGVLATSVLVGLLLNAWRGWWWADPLTGYVLVFYALREARTSLRHDTAVAQS